jgi:hypothetical protein
MFNFVIISFFMLLLTLFLKLIAIVMSFFDVKSFMFYGVKSFFLIGLLNFVLIPNAEAQSKQVF